MSVPLAAALDPLQDDQAVVPVEKFELRETVNDGWSASIVIVEEFATRMSSAGLLAGLLANQIRPGTGVALHLLLAEGEAAGTVLRIWPSIVTSIVPFRNEDNRAACIVRLRDVVGFNANRAVWGAYRNRPLAEMFGGMMSCAGFGDGVPSTKPRLWPGLDVTIKQELRDELNDIPYTISVGDPFRWWIDSVFGQLGVRYEMIGTGSGGVEITLRDAEPSSAHIDMEAIDIVGFDHILSEFEVDRMALREVKFVDSTADSRAVMLDSAEHGEFRRVGQHGSIGTVIADPHTGVDEAALRAKHSASVASLNTIRLTGSCSQSALHPCQRIRFTNRTVGAADTWQAVEVVHGFDNGDYLNVSLLLRDFEAWRPPVFPSPAPVLITGVIDDEETEANREVVRDELGRVPVVFPFLPTQGQASEDEDSSTILRLPGGASYANANTASGDGSEWTRPRLHLGLLETMAGGRHGMVSAARQGNVCRVAIYNPLFAEIVGFGYRGDLRIGEDFADVSTGLLTRHSPEDPWSGMTFRPTTFDIGIADINVGVDVDLESDIDIDSTQP